MTGSTCTMWNPCCGRDIVSAAKIVAVIDVIFSILELIAAFIFESGPVTILSMDSTNPEKRDVNYEVSITLLFAICLVIMRIMQLGCSVILLYGVFEKNYRKCAIWFIFALLVVGLAVLQIIFEIWIRANAMIGTGFHSPHPLHLRLIIPGMELLLMWYFLWVVAVFMRHIRKMGDGKLALGNGSDPREPRLIAEEVEMISKI